MKSLLRLSLSICLALLFTGAAAAQTFSINSDASAGGLPIPDNDPTGVSQSVDVSAPGMMIIAGGDAPLVITHTWVGDLIYSIESAEGTTVVVMDRPGVPASTFGCDGDNVDAAFSDAGTDGPVEDMCSDLPAIFGSPLPHNPFTAFIGEDPNGTWTVTVSDNAVGDTGTLDFWDLAFNLGPIVSNEGGAELPDGYSVSSAYPNPFNPQTQFVVQVGVTQNVMADVYNPLGQKVARIFDGVISAGQTETVTFEAGSLPSGLYVVRVAGQDFATTRRVSLLK